MSKTQWGKFRGQAAGLMYLDLTFHQPADCKLAQATITMNFYETERRRRQTNTSSLEITEFFGPQILTGEKRERQVLKTFEATPKVGAANASVEGIGISRKPQANYASRWDLRVIDTAQASCIGTIIPRFRSIPLAMLNT
ncbi:uncharacterized protein BO87DRAFT_425568 [Aspergillus neoniger CBS 115656]|uniref:Uncharacterized protein n=1 Tax=Aspergillus neoniger (strain CBS 115656) TaxID=1448310 RepID=A0A318YL85_ASPNB|nr:hypothetical protein BO87DRAFT_425568 [Aspergillus neoniger CBS 115656]PYH34894.1 hypothetical protein BO87DRAFT_425568 [Aspergillus neoniger CBS 115656]